MRTPKCITFPLGFGIVLIIIGIVIVITKPNEVVINHVMNTNNPLVNGSASYNLWKLVDIEFKVYFFDIMNPEAVEKSGATAILVERGPYVYDVRVEKIVIAVNESADTIDHMTKRTFFFNAIKSGNLSEHDEITILNSVYIGTITKIAVLASSFVSTIGADVPLLFTVRDSIFLKGQVKDILFDGLSITCDLETYPQLGTICSSLEHSRPPLVREGPEKGSYRFSYFHKMNGTSIGPFTISRGVKDRFTTGLISQFKGSHYSDVWNEDDCSVVKGTDALFYPPMRSREKEMFTFIPELCSAILVEYKNDKVFSGLVGYHYRTSMKTWDDLKPSCYCPKNDTDDAVCPLPGLLDLDKCQESPVLMSEAHFLHGDPGLYSIVQGFHADEEKHASYVVVEPLTGAPLSGSKKMQLNMILEQQPVDLLANVSQGVFPLLWVDEGFTPETKFLELIILLHRVKRLLDCFIWIPFIVGIFFVVYSFWMNVVTENGGRTSGRVTILAPKNTPNN